LPKKTWKLLFCLSVAAVLLPLAARADELRLLPSIAEKVEYNDNIFITPSNAPASQKFHDFISTTSGGLQLLSNTERLNLDVSARVDQLFYKDNPSFNSTDQFYKAALKYSLTQKLSVSLRGEFDRDSRPDRELFTSGLVLSLSALRREVSMEGLTADYALTSLTTASLMYDHGQYWFKNNHGVDMTYDTSSLSFIRDVSDYIKNLKARFTLGYSRYNFTGLEVDNYEATTGLEYALQEKWKFLMDVGARYTESYFETLKIIAILGPFVFVSPTNVTSTGSAFVGKATLAYTGEKTTGNIVSGRDVMPAYGSLGTVERTFATANINRRFTYELSGFLDGGYFINKTQAGQLAAFPLNTDTFYGTAGLRYQFNRGRPGDMYLEGSYNFVWIENKAANPITVARRNLFVIRFFVQHAILE
jgi:hypothetical protein